jgi:hypothetical protein
MFILHTILPSFLIPGKTRLNGKRSVQAGRKINKLFVFPRITVVLPHTPVWLELLTKRW